MISFPPSDDRLPAPIPSAHEAAAQTLRGLLIMNPGRPDWQAGDDAHFTNIRAGAPVPDREAIIQAASTFTPWTLLQHECRRYKVKYLAWRRRHLIGPGWPDGMLGAIGTYEGGYGMALNVDLSAEAMSVAISGAYMGLVVPRELVWPWVFYSLLGYTPDHCPVNPFCVSLRVMMGELSRPDAAAIREIARRHAAAFACQSVPGCFFPAPPESRTPENATESAVSSHFVQGVIWGQVGRLHPGAGRKEAQ